MADAVEESPAQRQARQRREKRNARITSEGADRLAKITGVSGRPPPAVENVSQRPQPPVSRDVDDPAEVDISEHLWTPEPRRPSPSPGAFGGQSLAQAQRPQKDPNADPMMQMMQQMLGGQLPPGMDGASANGEMPNLPPFLKAMMNGQAQATQQAAQSERMTSDTAYIWRIVHALFALGLGLYVAMTTTFDGSKFARLQGTGISDDTIVVNVFYIFATVETVLQSSRYFLEKGQLQGSGWLATIANSGMVPEPFNGYLKVAGRYITIWNTVVGDAMALVFVLGVVAWWKGLAAA